MKLYMNVNKGKAAMNAYFQLGKRLKCPLQTIKYQTLVEKRRSTAF